MAISKQIININGSETNYHKIKNVTIDNENGKIKCKITICNYLNEDYRKKDKRKKDAMDLIIKYRQELDDEYKNEPYDEEKVNNIIEKLNEQEKIYYVEDYFSIDSKEIVFEDCKDIDLQIFYDKLKETKEFSGAKNV